MTCLKIISFSLKSFQNSATLYTVSKQLVNASQKRSICKDSTRSSRFSASTLQTGCDVFNFNDYDCIGFDLDNTLCSYKITNMVTLEYEVLSKYLVEQKGYDPKYLLQPLNGKVDFLQKGLIMDFARGNVLRIAPDGYIEKATHGTKILSDREISDYYGLTREWTATNQYVKDLLATWNSPLEREVRTCLDYFDMPAALCFAHCIDSIDKGGNPKPEYDVWPDVLEGLMEMFTRENYALDMGGFFPTLKKDPNKFINKCSDNLIQWLKDMHLKKTTFMLTGSNVDFANFVAKNSMGENWRDLFDVVIYYARKPGFFTANRPFIGIENESETKQVEINHRAGFHAYSQGNWKGLIQLLGYLSGENNPKIVYIGDNIIQDVYTPSKFQHCDTIALVEEMFEEGIQNYPEEHPDRKIFSSKMWGSYFNTNYCGQIIPSLWSDIIHKHSKMCIPSLGVLARNPIDHRYITFSSNEFSTTGFYPGEPNNIAK